MGLVEKRMLARLQSEILPKYQDELRAVTGSEITYDVDWDSFADNQTAMGNLPTKALQPLVEIFRAITIDDIGKEAVQQGIHTIRLSHGEDANISSFTLLNGTLLLPWDWEGWAGSFFPDSVREKIESML